LAPVQDLATALGRSTGGLPRRGRCGSRRTRRPSGLLFPFQRDCIGTKYADDADHPTGLSLTVDFVYRFKTNPKSSDYRSGSGLALLNDAFNVRYTMMLKRLAEAIAEVPNSLYNAIMNGMHPGPTGARGDEARISVCPNARRMSDLRVEGISGASIDAGCTRRSEV
jgi:hypothetical protein